MPDDQPTRLRIADLSTRGPTTFDLAPDAAARAALAAELGIPEIRKLRFAGTVRPQGGRDWRLEATLGATVVQPCVVTLAPVTTRIDEDVARTYIAGFDMPDGGEAEMPEDDSLEPLPAVLDLSAVLAEALALALPAFPRAEGAALGEAVYAADGVDPMTDDDAKPLAGLKALKDRLQNP